MRDIYSNSSEHMDILDLAQEAKYWSHDQDFNHEAAESSRRLGAMAMRFAQIERVPRYNESSRENDAEHSFMLSLIATELAASYYSDLNVGLVAQFSTVHDLVELETNDVATFLLDNEAIAAKEAAEHAACENIAAQLPYYTRQLFLRYEAQVEPEARFVRLVDKILPVIVDIIGPGKKVMVEDYGITTVDQLMASEKQLADRLRERFPDASLDFLHDIRSILSAQFVQAFQAS